MENTVNRRAFLKKTAGVAAGVVGFPYIVQSSALGKAGTVAPSNRLTFVQIGSGSMGTGDLNAFLSFSPEVQAIAVCDVEDLHSARAKQIIDKKNGNRDCRTYRDFRELLDREDVDIASLALPDQWHGIISVACARKGIDIYGQKPLARSIMEGRAICDAVQRYGVIWQTGSWQRSVKHFHQAAERVRNGRIGKVEYVEVGLPDGNSGPKPDIVPQPDHIDYDMWLGPAPWRPYQNFRRQANPARYGPHWDWRWIMDYSGGQLTDWAGHHIDIAHWGLGLDRTGPVTIEGKGEYPTDGIYDVPYAYDFMCTYANGVKIRVANASKHPKGMGACWYGDKGWIHVNRGGIQASDPKLLREKIGPNEIHLYRSENHQKNFLDCIKTRQETITPAEIAHRSISVGLLGEIAMQTGRKLRWNPEKELFVNDDEANRYLMRPYRGLWHL